MKALLAVAILVGAQPPGKEPPPAPAAESPQKKQVPEGNSDLAKLTPAVLNDMSRRIETALIGDTGTGTLGLKVAVEEQTIVISGDAPDEQSRKRTSEIATRIAEDELYRIVNRVRIKPAGTEAGARKEGVTDAPTAPDHAQLERVDAILREKLPELGRTVRARFRVDPMPCIVLEGVVDTMDQKVEVSRVIRSEVRSLPLLNNIQLRIKQNAPPRPAPSADAKQPRQMGAPPNKAVVIDSDTREQDVQLAGMIAQKIMGDARIWDTVVIIQVDGGLVWLKGTAETFAHKVRVVNHAERMQAQGVTYVIDDLNVAQALRGAQELSTAKAQGAAAAADVAMVEQDAVVYFQRYFRDSVPLLGKRDYTVEAREGQIRVSLKKDALSAEEMKRVSDSVQKLAADLGVKAVFDVQGGAGETPPPAPTPAPAPQQP